MSHDTDDHSADPPVNCYRMEFSVRACEHSLVETLDVRTHSRTAVVRFADELDEETAVEVLSEVLAPAEHHGVTVSGDVDEVAVLESAPTAVRVGLVVDA